MNLLDDYNFADQGIPFETIYTDVKNKGYEKILSYLEARIKELTTEIDMYPTKSSQADSIQDLLDTLTECHALMPQIIQETSYRYIMHRATPDEIESLTNQL